MRSIVVTGASGGIGTAVVDRLVRDGFHVYACARNPSAVRCTAPGADRLITRVRLDVTDAISIRDAAAPVMAGSRCRYGFPSGRGDFNECRY